MLGVAAAVDGSLPMLGPAGNAATAAAIPTSPNPHVLILLTLLLVLQALPGLLLADALLLPCCFAPTAAAAAAVDGGDEGGLNTLSCTGTAGASSNAFKGDSCTCKCAWLNTASVVAFLPSFHICSTPLLGALKQHSCGDSADAPKPWPPHMLKP